MRGENVLLLGEIDLDKDDNIPEPYREAPIEEVFKLKKETERREQGAGGERGERRAGKGKKLRETEGFEGDGVGEVLF